MTVGDFIEELKRYDPNLPIVAFETDSDDGVRYFSPWSSLSTASGYDKRSYDLPDGEFVVLNR